MAWFDTQNSTNKWVQLFTITKQSIGGDLFSISFSYNDEFSKTYSDEILKKFLSEIDSRELVKISKPKRHEINPDEIIFGGRNRYAETLILQCMEEDKDKILTGEPVRFSCCTDIETESKYGFIEFIKLCI